MDRENRKKFCLTIAIFSLFARGEPIPAAAFRLSLDLKGSQAFKNVKAGPLVERSLAANVFTAPGFAQAQGDKATSFAAWVSAGDAKTASLPACEITRASNVDPSCRPVFANDWNLNITDSSSQIRINFDFKAAETSPQAELFQYHFNDGKTIRHAKLIEVWEDIQAADNRIYVNSLIKQHVDLLNEIRERWGHIYDTDISQYLLTNGTDLEKSAFGAGALPPHRRRALGEYPTLERDQTLNIYKWFHNRGDFRFVATGVMAVTIVAGLLHRALEEIPDPYKDDKSIKSLLTALDAFMYTYGMILVQNARDNRNLFPGFQKTGLFLVALLCSLFRKVKAGVSALTNRIARTAGDVGDVGGAVGGGGSGGIQSAASALPPTARPQEPSSPADVQIQIEEDFVPNIDPNNIYQWYDSRSIDTADITAQDLLRDIDQDDLWQTAKRIGTAVRDSSKLPDNELQAIPEMTQYSVQRDQAPSDTSLAYFRDAGIRSLMGNFVSHTVYASTGPPSPRDSIPARLEVWVNNFDKAIIIRRFRSPDPRPAEQIRERWFHNPLPDLDENPGMEAALRLWNSKLTSTPRHQAHPPDDYVAPRYVQIVDIEARPDREIMAMVFEKHPRDVVTKPAEDWYDHGTWRSPHPAFDALHAIPTLQVLTEAGNKFKSQSPRLRIEEIQIFDPFCRGKKGTYLIVKLAPAPDVQGSGQIAVARRSLD